eukprot:TRINITY_DN102944_c0_g1_i1.p1 TRINITY_DN102944_c0_g1~~TRINITY_DN102944_c0_g1_i1.p1  ORF type:complete len:273 (-),score=27.24 TRINITY_DN102944_c0_g1_i1:125-943(-)
MLSVLAFPNANPYGGTPLPPLIDNNNNWQQNGYYQSGGALPFNAVWSSDRFGAPPTPLFSSQPQSTPSAEFDSFGSLRGAGGHYNSGGPMNLILNPSAQLPSANNSPGSSSPGLGMGLTFPYPQTDLDRTPISKHIPGVFTPGPARSIEEHRRLCETWMKNGQKSRGGNSSSYMVLFYDIRGDSTSSSMLTHFEGDLNAIAVRHPDDQHMWSVDTGTIEPMDLLAWLKQRRLHHASVDPECALYNEGDCAAIFISPSLTQKHGVKSSVRMPI